MYDCVLINTNYCYNSLSDQQMCQTIAGCVPVAPDHPCQQNVIQYLVSNSTSADVPTVCFPTYDGNKCVTELGECALENGAYNEILLIKHCLYSLSVTTPSELPSHSQCGSKEDWFTDCTDLLVPLSQTSISNFLGTSKQSIIAVTGV